MLRQAMWLAIGMTLLAGCSCSKDPVTKTEPLCGEGGQVCTANADCPERHICTPKGEAGCCTRVARVCEGPSDCCPGQVCSAGQCRDGHTECTDDASCGGERVCREWEDPVLGKMNRCTYPRCNPDGSCAAGQTCFAGYCLTRPPCNGECPPNTACVLATNTCHPFGDRCSLPPKEGALITFTEPDNVYDVCIMSKIACEYTELPPLGPMTDLGRHASVTVAGDKIVAAFYDGQHGDLVVADYDASGARLAWKWVDGLPTGGAIVAAPSGPRGGIADPGDDVGRYTDIAGKPDGTVYVSYYDPTKGELRFIERAPDGTWSAPHVIDGLDADVGLYTSIAIDPAGRPALAYSQRAGEAASASCADAPATPKQLISAVKYAVASTEHPTSAGDWTIETVRCGARATPPCYLCETPGAEICTLDPVTAGATLCEAPSTGCTPACASGDVCVQRSGQPVCAKPGAPRELVDIPRAVGLFPSLAFRSATPVIAWYDGVKGDLMVSHRGASSWTSATLDGAAGTDVGLFPSLAFDTEGRYRIAYQDRTGRALRLYSSDNHPALPAPGVIIDAGLAPATGDGPSWVGADASLLSTSFGTFVAYQNSTASDLRLRKLDGSTWVPVGQGDWTEGAVGFFTDMVAHQGKLYVVHARLHTTMVGGTPTLDNSLRLEVVTP